MPITLDGTNGITTPTYGGADTSEYLVPVTQFKNRIINGAMTIDQRNAGASVAVADSTNTFITDRWSVAEFSTGSFSWQQVTDAPAGFVNSLKCTVNSASSASSSDIVQAKTTIEGFNVGDLNWGTANAKTVTLSFWVKSSLTGQFGGSLSNSAINRSYPYSYTISSANTWEYKNITIAGDTTGTWLTDNGVGMFVFFDMGTGSTRLATAGSWQAGDYRGATGDTKVIATNGATWAVTGVQLEVGSTATSFDYRPYGTELALCQRYFEAGSFWREGTNAANGNFCVFSLPFLVQKRANATFTYGNVNGANAGVASIQGPEAIYESISPYDQTNSRTGFAFRFTTNNATSTIRQYFTASAEL